MSLSPPLRRPFLAVTTAALLAAAAVGLLATAGTAGAVQTANGTQGLPLVSLQNDTAAADTECPAGEGSYWHFVFAPADGSASFVTVALKLTTGPDTSEDVFFTGDQLIPNGDGGGDVFVAVPDGHELTDLVALGSYAAYQGTAPSEFNLAGTCEPEATPPATTPETTVTTVAPAAPLPEVDVLGAVQTTSTVAPADAEVAGAVQVGDTLPYTGSETTGIAVVGLAVLAVGGLLVGLARRKGAIASQA